MSQGLGESLQTPIIRAAGLRKTFRVLKRKHGLAGAVRNLFSNDCEEVKAVDNISFEIAAGELVGYIGPNGAGKSTTIKMLTGILHPTGGEMVVDGLVPQGVSRPPPAGWSAHRLPAPSAGRIQAVVW
jgi:ABC-type uncharacterized transport system ATPase subunit